MGRKFEVRKAAMQKTMIAKSKVYSKFGKELYMCAKSGGANPDSNLALKHLISKAKNADVPTDVIKRNIKKAAEGVGEDYVPIRYEGFGPGGTGFIVDTLTDNVNRTVAEVRNCFTKTGCTLGVNGCVEHGYNHLSYVTIKGMNDEEALETLLMADLDVNDIEEDEDMITVESDGYSENKIAAALEEAGAEIVESENGWYPMNHIELNDSEKELLEKLVNMLNDVEDVQEVYHNAKLD